MVEQKQTPKTTTRQNGIKAILIAVIISAIAVVVALSAFSVDWRMGVMESVSAVTDSTAVKTKRVLITVEGMSCPGSCPSGITAMLNRTPGVVSAEVSFERKEADVEFDPRVTSPEKIVEAINNMGYRASGKS